MNDVIQSILRRYSTRQFAATSVPEELVEALEKAALAAPTAKNGQELRFTFIRNPEIIQEVHRRTAEALGQAPSFQQSMRERQAQTIFYGAPLVILITSVEAKWDREDAGIACQSIVLAAESLGLATCINGVSKAAFEADNNGELARLLGMTPDENYRIMIAVGYGEKPKDPHALDQKLIRRVD